MTKRIPQDIWDSVKTEYLTGTTPLRELGKKYGVDYTTICKKAKKENWNALKQIVQQEADERTKAFVVDIKISNNERAINITNTLLAKLEDSANTVKSKDISAIKGIVASLQGLREMEVFKLVNENADIKVEMASVEEYSE